MFRFLLILCLIVNVLARPEPEPEPGYSYSNGLNHNTEINHNQGYTTNGYSSSSSSGFTGGNIGFDTGNSNHFNSPSGFSLPSQHTQIFTIQPSQSFDISSISQPQQQSHQHSDQQHNSFDHGNDGFIGHRTYGNQPQEERHNGDNNGGEGIIEPRLNDSGPSTNHADPPQNTYVPPPSQSAPQSTLYAPPPPPPPPSVSNNKYVPPPPAAAPQNSYIPPPIEHPPIQQNNGYSSYQPSPYISTDGYYPAAKQIIHKHVYVHVPPKDFEDEPYPRQHFQIPQAQKHYKIIFIKAPSAPIYQPPIIPPIPQNEEKTLIYVLHRKPEEPEDIILPTPIPTQPSKPEVYFIKYKTRKDNLPGLYGAPASAPSDTISAAGYGEATSHGISSSLTQTTTGHNNNIENDTNIPTEDVHHQSTNHVDDISTSTLHSASSSSSSSIKSSSYGPPSHKSY